MRQFMALLFLLATATGLTLARQAPGQEIKIAWYGQAMFLIVSPGGTRIVIDPQNLEAYRVSPIKADAVVMSHLHTDHTNLSVIANVKEARQIHGLKKTGPGVLDHDWNVIDEKVGDVRIQTVPTYHDQMSGLQRGKNSAILLDIDGVRIVHLGDLGHTLSKAQLKKFGTVDVLLIPTGGVYTLNGLEAFKVAFEQIKPRRWVIPMHYGTIVYDDLLPLKYFTDECKDADVPVIKFKPRTWLTIDPRGALPKQPAVAVLDYSGAPVDIKLKGK